MVATYVKECSKRRIFVHVATTTMHHTSSVGNQCCILLLKEVFLNLPTSILVIKRGFTEKLCEREVALFNQRSNSQKKIFYSRK